MDRVLATDTRVCLLGLSFKTHTDDLRESPARAGRALVGKGLELRIYDPIVRPDRLVGGQPAVPGERLAARQPAAGRSPEEALDGADVVIVASSNPAVLGALGRPNAQVVFDTQRSSGRPVERSRATTASAGDQDRGAGGPSARPDHRPEPLGPVRPAGLAGVPGPDRGRLRRDRRLPEGEGTGAYRSSTASASSPTGPTRPGGAAVGFVAEYVYSFLATPRLALRGGAAGGSRWCRRATRRTSSGRSPVAAPRDGTRFVFDHHDLCPELYKSRFPAGLGWCTGMRRLERGTYRSRGPRDRDERIVRRVAIGRGGKAPRTASPSSAPGPTRRLGAGTDGPELPARPRAPRRLHRRDGSAGRRRHRGARGRPRRQPIGRRDIAFTLMGGGDSFDELVACGRLGCGPRRDSRAGCRTRRS